MERKKKKKKKPKTHQKKKITQISLNITKKGLLTPPRVAQPPGAAVLGSFEGDLRPL